MIKSSRELTNTSFFAKYRWLLLWTSINLIIFLVCFMNYKLQLKHRYLYKILKDGLSFSRAAAMVINFNLLLVWLPMCKYSLTKLAYRASECHRRLRLKYKPASLQEPDGKEQLTLSSKQAKVFATLIRNTWFSLKKSTLSVLVIAIDNSTSLHTICAATITIASVIHTIAHLVNVINFSRNYDPFLSNLNMAQYPGQAPVELLLSVPGITGILMILILGLMTFSSLTKVRSKSFNKFQFIHRLSIPFVICLLLHPMTHVLKEQINIDRHNPDFCDNRTTINYEISDLLESEQASLVDTSISDITMENAKGDLLHNIENEPVNTEIDDRKNLQNSIKSVSANANHRHEFVLNKISANNNYDHLKLPNLRRQNQTDTKPVEQTSSNDNITPVEPSNRTIITTSDSRAIPLGEEKTDQKALDKSTHDKTTTNSRRNNQTQLVAEPIATTTTTTSDQHHNRTISIQHHSSGSAAVSRKRRQLVDSDAALVETDGKSVQSGREQENLACLDARPLFVAQSSICWYVLAMGLPCYLIDLFLRKWRRSKSSIQLLGYRSDGEGNLIELILSNNHKRFAHWQPGQFIYLNCPQIAHFEWHPFTISSMDNLNGQFTLHIKTAGDWTSELRKRLLFNQDKPYVTQTAPPSNVTLNQQPFAMNCFNNNNCPWWSASQNAANMRKSGCHLSDNCSYIHSLNIDKLNYDQGEAGDLKPVAQLNSFVNLAYQHHQEIMIQPILCNHISNNQEQQEQHQHQHHLASMQDQDSNQSSHSINLNADNGKSVGMCPRLDLFIDGPFHSPFERLLEQEVSVCIANGVGWTAFSSIFHNLINNLYLDHDPNDWWSKWRNFAIPNRLVSQKSLEIVGSEPTFDQLNASGHHEFNGIGNQTVDRQLVRNFSIQAQIHMMIIVPNIDQLKPFFLLALSYFRQFHQKCSFDVNNQNNPIREISAFLTRAQKGDADIMEFCNMEHLIMSSQEDCIIVNEVFRIYLGKPQFEHYLTRFSSTYSNKRKISVYCCGSNIVKRSVQSVCKSLNHQQAKAHPRQVYSYHEENF